MTLGEVDWLGNPPLSTMTEQEYTLRRDLLRDTIRRLRAELEQLEQDLNELEQEWNDGV